MEAHLLLVLHAATFMMMMPPSLQQQSPCPTPDGDHNDNNSCFTFNRCSDGVATLYRCPSDQPYFDQAVRRCTTRPQVGCFFEPAVPPTQPPFAAALGGNSGYGAGPVGGANPSFVANAGSNPIPLANPVAPGGGAITNDWTASSPVGVVIPVGVARQAQQTMGVVSPGVAVPVRQVSPQAVGGAVSTNARAGTGGGGASAKSGASARFGPVNTGFSDPSFVAGTAPTPSPSPNAARAGGNSWQLIPPGSDNALSGVWIADANGQPVLWVPGAGFFTPVQQTAGSGNTARGLTDFQRVTIPPPTPQQLLASTTGGLVPVRPLSSQDSASLSDLLDFFDFQGQGQGQSQAEARASAKSGPNSGAVSASAAAVASGNSQGQSQAQGQARVQGHVKPGGEITAVFPLLVNSQGQLARIR